MLEYTPNTTKSNFHTTNFCQGSYSHRRAAHHPAHTPTPLPIPLTMNAAISPNRSPAAQPIEAPTFVPMKMKNFTPEP